jgi:hypothetical protein
MRAAQMRATLTRVALQRLQAQPSLSGGTAEWVALAMGLDYAPRRGVYYPPNWVCDGSVRWTRGPTA